MSFDSYAMEHTKELIDSLRKKDRSMPAPRVLVDAKGEPIKVPESMHQGFCEYLNKTFDRWAKVPRQDMLMQFFPQVVGFAALYFSHTRESMGVDEKERYGFIHANHVFSFWGICDYNPDIASAAINLRYETFENHCEQQRFVWLIPEDDNKPMPDNEEGARIEEARQRLVYHIQYFQAKQLMGDVERRECKHTPADCALKGLGYGRVLRYLNCGFMSDSYARLREKEKASK